MSEINLNNQIGFRQHPFPVNRPGDPFSSTIAPTPYPTNTPFLPPTSIPYPVNPPKFPVTFDSDTSYSNQYLNMNPNNPTAGGFQTSPTHPATSSGYQTSPTYPATSSGYQTSPTYPATSAGFQTSPTYPATSGGYPGGDHNYPNPTPAPQPAVCPTAPDLSQIQKIPGYEQISLQDEVIMPPSLPVWQPDVQERKEMESLPSFTEEEVREAVTEYASQNCCYGSAPAKGLIVTNITMMSAFHYKVETFGEKRESAWRFLPYDGQPIDGPMNGPAPRPWDVVALPSFPFQNTKAKMEVPHTAFVKPCHSCVGNGRVRCDECMGNGRKQCTWCNGRGRRSDNDPCTSCNTTGFQRCFHCSGNGQVKCKTCNGKGQLKGFVELTVTWTNHVDDYISETSKMPKELVREVTGQVAYEEENPRVSPIIHSSDQAVNRASSDLINKHNNSFPNERILKQKQCLRLIPIGEVNYVWKEKPGQFYVYGYEHKVYFKDYPQKCCCCVIL